MVDPSLERQKIGLFQKVVLRRQILQNLLTSSIFYIPSDGLMITNVNHVGQTCNISRTDQANGLKFSGNL